MAASAQAPNGGCTLCGIIFNVGDWRVHERGKRHQAALAAAALQQRTPNSPLAAAAGAAPCDAPAPPPAKKAKLTAAPHAAAPPAASPLPRARSPSPPRIAQTDAMKQYRLTKKELDAALTPRLATNPHCKRGAPMRLFVVSEVAALSMKKHGSAAQLEASKAKSAATSAKAAATRAFNDGWREGANPTTWSVATHGAFTPQFRATVRAFLLAAHRLRLFGGADSFAALTQRVVTLMVSVVPPRANQLAKKQRPRSARFYGGGGYRSYGYSDYDSDGSYGDFDV